MGGRSQVLATALWLYPNFTKQFLILIAMTQCLVRAKNQVVEQQCFTSALGWKSQDANRLAQKSLQVLANRANHSLQSSYQLNEAPFIFFSKSCQYLRSTLVFVPCFVPNKTTPKPIPRKLNSNPKSVSLFEFMYYIPSDQLRDWIIEI